MTGFALARREHSAGTVFLELRSVNSRYLDPQFRISEELRAAETVLREALVARLSRGKLDCRFYIHRASQTLSSPQLNTTVIEQLALLEASVLRRLPAAQPLTVAEVLHWPGVMQDSEFGGDDVLELAKGMVTEAIDQLLDARSREGDKLRNMILERVAQMEGIAQGLKPLVPQLVASYQQKLVERLQLAIGIATTDPKTAPVTSRDEAMDRIRQEVTLYGVRIDVAEELSRLSAHLSETRSILNKGGAVGKRLDFMIQELNREANTLGSKSAAAELADAAMQLKLLIEQMREQVQNLE